MYPSINYSRGLVSFIAVLPVEMPFSKGNIVCTEDGRHILLESCHIPAVDYRSSPKVFACLEESDDERDETSTRWKCFINECEGTALTAQEATKKSQKDCSGDISST